MAIYRGDGGAGDADNDVTVTTVTQKALEAETSATEAAASATQSANSASAAATSATNAATSETNASTSASNASTSATNAATSATSASTSASNAASSASAASTSETNAASSASAASTSASNAATSESNAATSESNAASSASAASTSATNAATSASAASTSATNAATSATNAATSETNAATSASNAAASYDSFDDRYLGAKASDPTLDNDGDALITGALYFNTTDDEMRVYTGSAWVAAYVSLGGALLATNNLSDLNNAATARTNLGLGTAATTASTDYATAAQGALADSALQNLVEDTTPQLGGTLDANLNNIDMGLNVITDTKVGQWDTAYGWGDHSVAGYLTSFTETNDLTAAVTWANVPDANITQSSVTQHQAALSITESQISDLQSYLTTVALNDVSDVTITTPSTGQVLKYNGTIWVNDADTGGIDNVVEDTTPQLGGNLDLNSSDITGTGNINITGTVTADGLDVNGNELILDADGDTSITADTDDQIDIKVGGTDSISITPSQITITDADSNQPRLLLKNTNADSTPPFLDFQKDSASPADSDVIGKIRFIGDDDGGNTVAYATIVATSADVSDVSENGDLRFETVVDGTNAERMRINSSGDVYVGETTGGAARTGTVRSKGYNTRTGHTGSLGGNIFNINWTGSAAQLWIDTTNIGTFISSSDYRIKRNIETQTEPALNRIAQLRPVTYQPADYGAAFVASDEIKEGFIAHELAEVIPSAVEGEKDAEDQIQSLKLDALCSVMVKAIQEQQEEISQLKARIEALEAGV